MEIEEKLDLILEHYKEGKIHNPEWSNLAIKVSGSNGDGFRILIEKLQKDGYVRNNEITADGLIHLNSGGYAGKRDFINSERKYSKDLSERLDRQNSKIAKWTKIASLVALALLIHKVLVYFDCL
jgi:hypothetical protein